MGTLIAFVAIASAAISRRVFSGALVLACLATGTSVAAGSLALRPEILANLAAFGVGIFQSRRVDSRLAPALWILGAWLTWCAAVSIAFSPEVGTSISLLVWYAISISLILSLPRLFDHQFVKAATLVVTGHALFALTYWTISQWGGGDLFVQRDTGGSNARAMGIALEPNILASTSGMWLAVMYYHRRIFTKWWIISLPIIGLVIVCTLTRTTIVAVLLALAYIIMRHARQVIVPAAYIAISVGTMVLWLGSPLSADSRTSNLVGTPNFASGTGAFRLRSWKIAFNELGEHYNLIHGFGTVSFQQRHWEVRSNELDYLSNFWISLMYDGGLIGFLLFLIAVYGMFARIGFISDLVPFLVISLLTLSLTNTAWLGFTWLCVGALVLRSKGDAMVHDARDSRPGEVVARDGRSLK